MAQHPNISHARDLSSEIAEQNARMRELLADAAEVLKLPMPDTFLGRKTQEPFPMEATRD
ncbi:hypothetical protein [Bradyrhizobium arachidis]|uniref:Uncharacterized protein n=1 Tax=Bradyrhizobium arachidis TaxID=858423 RepID=A0AAE7NPA5_9BRAD|nr:hypothetical protein [Bradyrhizobium arachidis]QOZ68901.1 hypothetical protein WN72_23155 [Bradyrhizobium arachidis]SFV19445.1 hypothetical protein SAMN05192541_15126 [Bradyrhizobium arachidis]